MERLNWFMAQWGGGGGTERFAEIMLPRLLSEGFSISLYIGKAHHVPKHANLHVNLLPGGAWRGRVPRAWALTRDLERLRSLPGRRFGLLRAPNLDVYRAGGGCHARWWEVLRAQGLNPVQSQVERWETQRDQAAVRTAGVVVVNSQLSRTDLIRHYGIKEHRILLLRNGVDLSAFQPKPNKTARMLVFMGNGWVRKGLSTALRAMHYLPHHHLEIWGKDSNPARFIREAAELGVADRVRFRGACADPASVWAQAAAVLHPTRYDPGANLTLEALACGTPVITSLADGSHEILPRSWMAIPDPTDDQSLAQRVVQALQEDGLADECRAAAEVWDAERTKHQWIDHVFSPLLQGRTPNGPS
jgi:UDP-glucose:(heptosyl)LPS alpha-1,3-glucosyltransferase